MQAELKSKLWPEVANNIRQCHLSMLSPDSRDLGAWQQAFKGLMSAITDERKLDPAFCQELSDLTEATGFSYDFKDILEEYFDLLEAEEKWDAVITSCDSIINYFKWEKAMPSQYMFRKGNALNKAGRYAAAEAFGKEWLDKYPTDLYAAASNAFLYIELGKLDKAKAITEKYLKDDLVCDSTTDTFFMAAYRLYEMTDDINAKQRVEQKMAEYQNL